MISDPGRIINALKLGFLSAGLRRLSGSRRIVCSRIEALLGHRYRADLGAWVKAQHITIVQCLSNRRGLMASARSRLLFWPHKRADGFDLAALTGIFHTPPGCVKLTPDLRHAAPMPLNKVVGENPEVVAIL